MLTMTTKTASSKTASSKISNTNDTYSKIQDFTAQQKIEEIQE